MKMHHSPVTVLGQHHEADTLFPNGEDPIGQEVLLEGQVFTVIGVLEDRNRPWEPEKIPEDNIALVPFSVIRKLHPEFKECCVVLAKADSAENLPLVVDEVARVSAPHAAAVVRIRMTISRF